jgi:hypothetical protein
MPTCRFCDNWRDQNMVHYGRRHYAHFECYLESGKSLLALQEWKIGQFPYRLLQKHNVVDARGRFVDPKLHEKLYGGAA